MSIITTAWLAQNTLQHDPAKAILYVHWCLGGVMRFAEEAIVDLDNAKTSITGRKMAARGTLRPD